MFNPYISPFCVALLGIGLASCTSGQLQTRKATTEAKVDSAMSDVMEWADQDREAAEYTLSKASGVRTLTLDLSDPSHAHFLKRHYEIAGMTSDKYPGLHKLMQDHRVIHARDGVTLPVEVQMSDDLIYTSLTTLMLAVYPTSTVSEYYGSAVASMEAAADNSGRELQIQYSGLCFYDQSNNPIGTCATQSSFGSGQYFPVNHSVSTPDNAFTAAFTATYYDVTNKRYVPQLSTLTLDTIDYPLQQTISDPVIVHPVNNQYKTAYVCTSRTVNANANNGGTCDYGTYSNTDVLVNMEGSVTYKPGQSPKVDGSGDLVGIGSVALINTQQGGGCRLAPAISGNNFFSQPQVTYTAAAKTLQWNFDNLNFGSTTDLLCGGDGTDIQFSLTLQVDDAVNGSDIFVASQMSVADTITPTYLGPNAGALATPMLRLVAGCLHPDTEITMGDASSIQSLASIKGEGENVASAAGYTSLVHGTVEGREAELYVIDVGENMRVKASSLHPFAMSDGTWQAASDLRTGDSVRTLKGDREIQSIDVQDYGGIVYNLMLNRPEDMLPRDTGSFYANGFLVGDHTIQQDVASKKQASPERVEPLIPAGFERDYASHLAAHSE